MPIFITTKDPDRRKYRYRAIHFKLIGQDALCSTPSGRTLSCNQDMKHVTCYPCLIKGKRTKVRGAKQRLKQLGY